MKKIIIPAILAATALTGCHSTKFYTGYPKWDNFGDMKIHLNDDFQYVVSGWEFELKTNKEQKEKIQFQLDTMAINNIEAKREFDKIDRLFPKGYIYVSDKVTRPDMTMEYHSFIFMQEGFTSSPIKGDDDHPYYSGLDKYEGSWTRSTVLQVPFELDLNKPFTIRVVDSLSSKFDDLLFK